MSRKTDRKDRKDRKDGSPKTEDRSKNDLGMPGNQWEKREMSGGVEEWRSGGVGEWRG